MYIACFKLNQRCFSFYRPLGIKWNCNIYLKFHNSRGNKKNQNFLTSVIESYYSGLYFQRIFVYPICPKYLPFASLTLHLPFYFSRLGRLIQRGHIVRLPATTGEHWWRQGMESLPGTVSLQGRCEHLGSQVFLSLGSNTHSLPSHFQVVTLHYLLVSTPLAFANSLSYSHKIPIGLCYFFLIWDAAR